MEHNRILKELYPFKIELHAHTTPASPCSQITPEEMVRIYKEHGFSGVVITNHFNLDVLYKGSREEAVDRYLSDFNKAKELGDKEGISVYLGAEVRFKENMNDYLIFGVDRDILLKVYDYLDKGIKAFREECSLPNSAFLQAHPFRDGMTRVDPKLLDGIEIFNMHPGHNSRNAFAMRLYNENPHFIVSAGSDFHHPNRGHEANAGARFKSLPSDSFGLFSLLSSGDYVFEIGSKVIIVP